MGSIGHVCIVNKKYVDEIFFYVKPNIKNKILGRVD